jgi:hypothetical protein
MGNILLISVAISIYVYEIKPHTELLSTLAITKIYLPVIPHGRPGPM